MFDNLAIVQRNRLTTKTLFVLFFALLADLVKVYTSIPPPFSWPCMTFAYLTDQNIPYFCHGFATFFKKRCHFWIFTFWICVKIFNFQFSFRSAQQFRNINKQKVTRNAKANCISLKTFEPKFEMILLKNVCQKDSNVKWD